MSNPGVRATLDVLTEVVTPALFTDENLLSLVICRMVNLSLEHGNSDGSCFAYVWLGMILGPHFADYRAGFRFGRLGYDLVEKRGLHRYQARAYMSFGNLVMPWTRHIQTGRDLVRRAFDAANRIGDLTFAAYSCNNLNTNLLASGDPLGDAQREAENGLDFARKARFGLVIDIITAQLGLIRTLRGLTPEFGSFNDERFNESQFEDHLQSDPRLALPECWYWIRKLQARVYASDYASAIEAASKAQQLLWTSPSFFEVAEFHFYDALARAAQCDAASAGERARHLETLAAHHKQLKVWAENCPENFANRAALVGAEIARLEGRELDAERLYEQAIRSARANGFIHNEALANELASRYYAARGLERFAQLCLRNARHGYLRWGADGKVRQLEQFHPHLRDAQVHASRTATIGAPVERLDVGTVLKAAQALSGEIVVDELIKTLLRIAVEHAGAGRGLLILLQGDEPRIAAEATTGRGQVEVALRQTAVSPAELPESLLHTVIRTRESVILDDALAQNPFSSDEYICHKHARSVLCLPLVKQSKLIGILYLENNLASHVFTPARISVLELLASQAAISLEIGRLYYDLGEREARIRRLVDSNIIGIVTWDLEGRIIEANQAFLDMVGYAREDLVSGQLRWTELTPAEWRGADEQIIGELKAAGTLQPREKEYFRKDGGRVPVLVGRALFEWNRDEGVSFVIDMTERKRAEEKLRASEQRLLDAQMELAHVNRLTTMGELAASIAHETNQPITATVTYALAARRFLSAEPPNFREVDDALSLIVKEGNRAGEVVGRIRALIKKAPARRDAVEINDAILEVIALTRTEAANNSVSVRTQLAAGLPRVPGDRVQLQQVLVNLIINAIEAMRDVGEEERELLISSRNEPDGVSVEVRDSGPGFTPADLDRVFEAFYTTKSDGLGLGLSICRSIIEAHNGRLRANPNVPRGASFQFVLPAIANTAS
jgi:PAS domain S-box-containing protein